MSECHIVALQATSICSLCCTATVTVQRLQGTLAQGMQICVYRLDHQSLVQQTCNLASDFHHVKLACVNSMCSDRVNGSRVAGALPEQPCRATEQMP